MKNKVDFGSDYGFLMLLVCQSLNLNIGLITPFVLNLLVLEWGFSFDEQDEVINRMTETEWQKGSLENAVLRLNEHIKEIPGANIKLITDISLISTLGRKTTDMGRIMENVNFIIHLASRFGVNSSATCSIRAAGLKQAFIWFVNNNPIYPLR
jgi:hypothetical protein